MSESKVATSANTSVENSLPVKCGVQEVKSDTGLLTERMCFCKICDIDFSTFPSLKDHLSASHTVRITSKSYFCQSCEDTFPSLPRFQSHLHREHTAEKIDACIKCHFKLPQERIVPTRSSGDTCPEHYCVICQAEMKAIKRKMKEDSRTQGDGKKKAPPGVVDSKQNGREIPRRKKLFPCEVCQTSYVHPDSLKNHLLTKHGIKNKGKPHHCTLCQKGFFTLDKLKIHNQREHVETKPHACGSCDQKFSLEKQLRKHSLVHNPPRQRCEVCLKELSRCYMRIHMRNHLGIKPHACVACDKRFASLGKLKIHLLIHTGEKPHSCDVCGKKFARILHLKTHLRVHTGERPYVCDFCNRGFTQKWVMYAHRCIHTGERPFECDVCQRGFIYKSQMKTHWMTHVKDELEN